MQTVKQAMDEYIENLSKETEQLKSRLETLYDAAKGKSRIFVDQEKLDELFHQAESIFYEVDGLKRANEIYYGNRGRASAKKSVSSKENGKLGGRPPKEISEAMKRVAQIEETEDINDSVIKKEWDDLLFKISSWKSQKEEILKRQGQSEEL